MLPPHGFHGPRGSGRHFIDLFREDPNVNANSVWVPWALLSALAGALFAWLWRGGYIARFATYVRLTNEELKKCSWPSWEELKGSTLIVIISIAILGGFTVAVDQILIRLFVLFKI